MDKAIIEFFTERKSGWLKKKVNPDSSEEEKGLLEQECEELFSLERWLPSAAKRAKQLSITSHPGKFSHTSAKISSIIAIATVKHDGFLRTGNVSVPLDGFGNAAAMDVYKFLMIKLEDGVSLIEHLEQDTGTIKLSLKINSASYDEIKSGLLEIKNTKGNTITSNMVKQVFFPCSTDNKDYHLLSIVTPSGIMFDLKKRIDNIRYSKKAKIARDLRKKGSYSEEGYDDLFGLTVIGFGGTKPQNVSVLNSQNSGKAYLLPTIPPIIKKRITRLPKHDFFENSLRIYNFKNGFIFLHKLLNTDYNNINIRQGIDKRIQFIIDQVVSEMWSIRKIDAGWSSTKSYGKLRHHHKIWLDEIYKQDREDSDEWLNKLIDDFARWIVLSYKKSLGKQAIPLADDELLRIKSIIEIKKEALR